MSQVAAWLTLSLACRNVWPAQQSGVFWGGLIMAANLYVMRLVVSVGLRRVARSSAAALAGGDQSVASGGASGSLALPAMLIASKFVVVLGATAAVVKWADPDPLGLVLGFSTLLAGIAGAAIHVAVQQKGAPSPWTTTPPG